MLNAGSFPIGLDDEARLARRRFLGALGAAVVAAVGGRAVARQATHHDGTDTPSIAANVVADLAPGDARVVARHGGETLVVRLHDGTTAAFDRRCPHLGCPVVWAAERERLECPCHRAAFDARTGGVLFGPPRSGLTAIRIIDEEEK